MDRNDIIVSEDVLLTPELIDLKKITEMVGYRRSRSSYDFEPTNEDSMSVIGHILYGIGVGTKVRVKPRESYFPFNGNELRGLCRDGLELRVTRVFEYDRRIAVEFNTGHYCNIKDVVRVTI